MWLHPDLEEVPKGSMLQFQELALTKEELKDLSLKSTRAITRSKRNSIRSNIFFEIALAIFIPFKDALATLLDLRIWPQLLLANTKWISL